MLRSLLLQASKSSCLLPSRSCTRLKQSYHSARKRAWAASVTMDADPLQNRSTLDGSPIRTSTALVDIPEDVLEKAKEDITVLDPFLQIPAEFLAEGEVVAFPTETVYGLGANALSSEAIRKIYAAKKRPSDNPLIVHVSSYEMLSRVACLDGKEMQKSGTWTDEHQKLVKQLCDKFWPGPLTILMPKSKGLAPEITSGLWSVGVRMPSHPVSLRLIALADVPVAAPSANISGRPSPTMAAHVMADLSDRIPLVVNGGPCSVGVESTVVAVHMNPPQILRPGGITLEQLREVLPNITYYQPPPKKDDDQEESAVPATPGLKYRHYAPNAKVILLEFTTERETSDSAEGSGSVDVIEDKLERVSLSCLYEDIRLQLKEKKRVAIFRTRTDVDYPDDLCSQVKIHELGSHLRPEDVARNLFAFLRSSDNDTDVIYVEGVGECHAGAAVMNRIRKAASEKCLIDLSEKA